VIAKTEIRCIGNIPIKQTTKILVSLFSKTICLKTENKVKTRHFGDHLGKKMFSQTK